MLILLCPVMSCCYLSSPLGTSEQNSGGGTRTPDTRIMIPNTQNHNLPTSNEKQQLQKVVYTSVYTTDSNLQFIIDSWGELPDDTKQTILRIVKIVHSQ